MNDVKENETEHTFIQGLPEPFQFVRQTEKAFGIPSIYIQLM